MHHLIKRGRVALISTVLTASALFAGGAGSAVGSPSEAVAAPARLVSVVETAPQQLEMIVHSPSMDREIPLTVLVPVEPDEPSPVLYLLNGSGGGEDSANWAAETRYQEFFADKNVYVVTPNAGRFSYYTDWVREDPVLGRNKWQTFLTEELPPLIDDKLNTTKVNGIAGISMAGTSVLNLAIAAPDLYRSVGAFSGCARTSDPLGQAYIAVVVADRGRGDITNMWGPLDGPMWRANDPYLNAHKLRDTNVYLTTATGAPGPYDRLDSEQVRGDGMQWFNQVTVGGAIEAVVHHCTVQMAQRLREVGAPVSLKVHPTGTHSWGYWQQDLEETWPSIAADLGAE